MKNKKKKNLQILKKEIKHNKPEVLETFSEMQRSYLTDLSKQNTKPEQLDQKNYFLYLIEKLLFRM
jgi:hypothetical protein